MERIYTLVGLTAQLFWLCVDADITARDMELSVLRGVSTLCGGPLRRSDPMENSGLLVEVSREHF